MTSLDEVLDRAAPPRNLDLGIDLSQKVLLLPPRQQEVLILEADGWSPGEIARQLGIHPGTVRGHLYHARKRMKTLMELERCGRPSSEAAAPNLESHGDRSVAA
jgi:DNA-directed RNA polymerase specialized sigma24 family protein